MRHIAHFKAGLITRTEMTLRTYRDCGGNVEATMGEIVRGQLSATDTDVARHLLESFNRKES